MKRATALAICPHLHDPCCARYAQENHALQAIAAWAQRFTPNVALVAPCEESDADLASGVLLEISGSVKLFNGAQAASSSNLRAGLALAGTCGPTRARAGAARGVDAGACCDA